MFHNKIFISVFLASVSIFLASCANTKEGQLSSTEADATIESSVAPAPEAALEIIAPSSAKSDKTKSSTQTNKTAKTGNEKVDESKLRAGHGDPVAGADKAALCMGCHGEVGISMDPLIPKLAGQYGDYIAKQVRNYQSSIRTHQIMGAIAASVTDEDLADISAYFGSQPLMKGDTPSKNQVGKDLFEHGDLSRMMVPCNNCHGVTGKGQNPRNATFPVIGGQHKDYLRGQILNFRKGNRNNSPGGIMNIIVQKLSDAEVDALAEYISGL